nr:hypothetical protein [Candidatus Mycoplasma haematolamae]
MTGIAKATLWFSGGSLALGGGAIGGHFLREKYFPSFLQGKGNTQESSSQNQGVNQSTSSR